MDYKAASEKIRVFAKTLAETGIEEVDKNNGTTVDRLITISLQLAWADSIRDQWEGFCSANPKLKAQIAVAKELMANAGYGGQGDPICGPPGVEASFAMVNGRKSVSFEHSMTAAMPLSAMFVNAVIEVMDAADKVSEAAAKQAEPKPDAGPAEITTAEVR